MIAILGCLIGLRNPRPLGAVVYLYYKFHHFQRFLFNINHNLNHRKQNEKDFIFAALKVPGRRLR